MAKRAIRKELGDGPRDRDEHVFAIDLAPEHELWVLSVPAQPLPAHLTTGEQFVLELALSGMTNASIARARGVSPNTVANQLKAAYCKLGCNSRSEALALLCAHRSDPDDE